MKIRLNTKFVLILCGFKNGACQKQSLIRQVNNKNFSRTSDHIFNIVRGLKKQNQNKLGLPQVRFKG